MNLAELINQRNIKTLKAVHRAWIEFEPSLGDVFQCCEAAVLISKTFDCDVAFTFNELRVVATTEMDRDDVFNQWMDLSNERKKAKGIPC